MPPMGLMCLASYLRTYGNHEIEIFDARKKESKPNEIADIIRKTKPDAVGITSFSMEYKEAHQVAAMSKEISPQIPVVIGGPYPTSSTDNVMEDENVDIAVNGEGEKSCLKLFNALERNNDLDGINGIAFRRNGTIIKTGPVEYIEDLDEIPFPAWDLIEVETYFKDNQLSRKAMNQHQWKKRVMQIITTRGCPYKCAYCHNLFGKRLRSHSVEKVIEELKLYKEKYRVQEVEILDDIFNLDLNRAKTIFRRIIEEKLDLKFSFPNGLRSDRFDEEFLDLMKEAGVYRLVFAIESGTPRIQKLIKKNVKLDVAKSNIELAAKRGFSVGGFFMLGFPGETEEELSNTIEFGLKSKLGTATVQIVTPFPGTELHRMALDKGFEFNIDHAYYQKVSLNISAVSSERLEQLRKYFLRKFYLNPVRLWRYARTSPWYNNFFGKLYILIMSTMFNYEK